MARKKKQDTKKVEAEWKIGNRPKINLGLASTPGEEARMLAEKTRNSLNRKADKTRVEKLEERVLELEAEILALRKKIGGS